MKKLLPLLALFFCWFVSAQDFCAFDKVMAETEAKYPELKKQRIEHDKAIAKEGIQNALQRLGVIDKTGKRTNTVYEVPVVVHVLEPNNLFGSMPTDTEIQNWIEQANQIFATTYGNGYYSEGVGNDGGTVFPFKLVLAKRTPDCTATTGIVRYNASGLPNYSTYGIPDDLNYPFGLFNLAPHWDENSYLNIYIVDRIYKANYLNIESGTYGWGGLPSFPNDSYHMFISKRTIVNNMSFALAHEMGHMLGLYHVFQKNDSPNIESTSCPNPAEVDCALENDRVCDTAPTICHNGINPLPTNNDINNCTGNLYDGIQYNIMNYTSSYRKFTPGQRNRTETEFLSYRKNLVTNSKALLPPDGTTVPEPIPACIPNINGTPVDFNYVGAKVVKLGDIDNQSTAFISYWGNIYEDFTKSCRYKNVTTNLNTGNNTIQIEVLNFSQKIRAWIDYNNDGIFTENEKILSDNYDGTGSTSLSYQFIIPKNVVYNTSLRLRIKCDMGDNADNPCADIFEGQVEDYIVIIDGDEFVITTTVNPENSGTVSGAGTYHYGDMVTLVAQPNAGYEFVNWTQNDVEVSTQVLYYFTALINRDLVANFRKKPTLNLNIFPLNSGSVFGAGEYNIGSYASVTAIPREGFRFVNWTENGVEISDNVMFDVLMDKNRNITANFVYHVDSGRQITGYQYWYDGNYDEKTSVEISPASSISFYNLFTGIENLSFGLHDVTFRAKDQTGYWSSAIREYFIKHPSLTKLEYWFDDDYGNSVTLPFTETKEFVFLGSVPAEHLSYGFHRVNFRSYDTAEKWSSVISAYFYKKPKLQTAEYWIDGNYNGRVTIPLNQDIFYFDQSVIAGSSDDKLHTITFRAKDEGGKWSSAISSYFMKKSKIVGYEYWFNDNYNAKIYNAVTPTDLLDLATNINVTPFSLSTGNNTFHFRAQNEAGKWSSVIDSVFEMGATLGVEVLHNEKGITLFPNPFEDIINVKSKNSEIIQVMLYDLSGKMIKEIKNINKKEFEFRGANLPSSMYLLMVITNEGSQSFKVIKK